MSQSMILSFAFLAPFYPAPKTCRAALSIYAMGSVPFGPAFGFSEVNSSPISFRPRCPALALAGR